MSVESVSGPPGEISDHAVSSSDQEETGRTRSRGGETRVPAVPNNPDDRTSGRSAEGRPSGPDASAIRVLPDDIIDQIAAGEVVERPASVVRELVENALDAGATHITVEADLGGKRLIRVVDNGCGMTAEDARTALMRHATSKLFRLEDIFSLTTMGFRGEALPSIAAVSRMVLTTRTRDQVAGTRLDLEAGQIVAESSVGAPAGTQIEVRDLLYNVPARLKFRKGNATETSHITDVVSRLAMANPQVHMRLRHASRTLLDAPSHKSHVERVRALLGSRFARRIHPVAGEEGGVEVEAYLTAPELAQATGRGVQIYIGRRPIKDRGLLQAVCMGYGELLPKGRYPVVVVFVDVPGGAVDVNVHPQKQEVRFSDPQAVYAAVRHTVRRGVAHAPWLSDRAHTGASPVHMRPAGRPGKKVDTEFIRSGAAGQPAIRSAAPPRPTGRQSPEPGPAAGHRSSALVADHAAETTRALFSMDRPGPRPGAPTAAQNEAHHRPTPQHETSASQSLPGRSADSSEPTAESAGLRRALFPMAPPADDDSAADRGGEKPAASQPWPPDLRARKSSSRAGERRSPWPYAARSSPAAQTSASPSGPPAGSGDRARPAAGMSADAAEPGSAQSLLLPDQAADSAARFFSDLHYIGQLDQTYLVCESRGEMILIDQHAAHERVAFQRLRERYQKREIPVQRMLLARNVELAPEQAAVAVEHAGDLGRMGFELEPFGGTTFALKTMPAGLDQGDAPDVLIELLSELAEQGGSRALEERLDLALATIACHSVVRAGDRLSVQEVYSLFHTLDEVEFKAHCPHGRPVLLRISIGEIARRFGRT
ncbi:MAG: DNA mismatch repair endonuclease MutL [Proteobacteria bacterium]|nr:DNA mismatch repair endonuclease MutL [Pseudomonadota bacterium]